jgi:hypothetical protein
MINTTSINEIFIQIDYRCVQFVTVVIRIVSFFCVKAFVLIYVVCSKEGLEWMLEIEEWETVGDDDDDDNNNNYYNYYYYNYIYNYYY